MPVPERRDFAALLALADAPLHVSNEPPDTLARHEAAEYLIEIETLRRRRWAEIELAPAWVWLTRQREFERAWNIVTGQRRRGRLSERRDQSPLKDRANARVDKIFAGKESVSVHWVSWGGWHRDTPFRHVWVVDCIRAVSEYLEGTAASAMVRAARDFEKARLEAHRAVQRFLDVQRQIDAYNVYGVRTGPSRSLSSWLSHKGEWDISALPLRRNDELARERLFVFRLWEMNTAFARSPKVEAIAELMGLEGFRHQYDVRTIERLCAGFRAERREAIRRIRSAHAGRKRLEIGPYPPGPDQS